VTNINEVFLGYQQCNFIKMNNFLEDISVPIFRQIVVLNKLTRLLDFNDKILIVLAYTTVFKKHWMYTNSQSFSKVNFFGRNFISEYNVRTE
jgi:hypothetical protein